LIFFSEDSEEEWLVECGVYVVLFMGYVIMFLKEIIGIPV